MPSPTVRKRKSLRTSSVVRRSFVLPAELVAAVREAAPAEYGGNANAAVRHALEAFVRQRARESFAREMAEMAVDPQVQAVNGELNDAFRHTLLDGLPDDPTW